MRMIPCDSPYFIYSIFAAAFWVCWVMNSSYPQLSDFSWAIGMQIIAIITAIIVVVARSFAGIWHSLGPWSNALSSAKSPQGPDQWLDPEFTWQLFSSWAGHWRLDWGPRVRVMSVMGRRNSLKRSSCGTKRSLLSPLTDFTDLSSISPTNSSTRSILWTLYA